jgi:hypothetical protein
MTARRGARRVKHPKKLGFKLVLEVRFGEREIKKVTPDASTICDVVYVALLAENGRSLKKGDVVKVGQTGQTKGSLMHRWKGIVGLFQGRKLKKNEREDRRRLLKAAKRKKVSVWAKAACKIKIPYAKGLTLSHFSARGAEEEFLDQYYQPRFGRRLNREIAEETD